MSKHTPGPWKVEFHGQHQVATENGDDSLEVAWVASCDLNKDSGRWYQGEVTEANARLIAAAPDLLVIAQRLVDEGLSMSLVA